MNLLVNQVPNLLDDRVPDGEDETANQVATEWGAEKRKVGEGFMWHDDIATKLGGYDPATAVSPAGPVHGWMGCLLASRLNLKQPQKKTHKTKLP